MIRLILREIAIFHRAEWWMVRYTVVLSDKEFFIRVSWDRAKKRFCIVVRIKSRRCLTHSRCHHRLLVEMDFYLPWIRHLSTFIFLKYLLIFDDSCEKISSSKQFVKTATAGRHKGLNIIYIKHNLFHQSKLRTDVELQNTHIVLFNSSRDVLQINKLSQQLGLGIKMQHLLLMVNYSLI